MLILPMFSPVDLILTMGFAWSISGIILLIINRRSMKFGIPLISIFTLTLLDNFVKPGMFHPTLIKVLFLLNRNSYFLIGPFLWFYTKSLITDKKITRPIFLLHITPFLFWVIQAIITSDSLLPPVIPRDIPISIIIRDLTSILSRIIYSIYTLYRIIRRSQMIKNF